LPQDIAQVAGFLCYFAAIALLFIYSIFNWKQVHLTEKLLAEEKLQVEALLGETIPKLEIAEAKYRHLVDDSADLIFQMDEDGMILSMNKTSRFMLGFNPEEMVGRTLYEFVTDAAEGDPELNRNIVRSRVREFLDSKGIIHFRTTLRKKHLYEPLDVDITLQKNLIQRRIEILGKVSRPQEDIAQRFLQKEKGRYVIGNNVTHAEVLSQRLTERLARYFPTPVLNTIRICFREILINAIEHGNLGITFDEKTRAIESGDYMEYLLARQANPVYADRRVYIDYLINERVLMFRVTDEGDGFDHRAFLGRAANDEYLAMLEHGRGIIMTKNVFDSLVFNDKGNQVIMSKKIPQ
jgi:PAS domain-containing protein